MVQTYEYRSPTTPGGAGWVVDLGNQAVRLGRIAGIQQEAELGAVGTSSIILDDPTGTAGHSGDAIVGLKQFTWFESLAPTGSKVIFQGYIGDRRYRRGVSDNAPSLITGAARVIDVTLVDINAFLAFRVLTAGLFNRPAETDVARVTALLGVSFLSTTLYNELGFVSSANPVDMDAVDYTGQRPADVLNDCAQQSGKNYFVIYNEATGNFNLWYDTNDSANWRSTLQVSNVLADVDGATTFAPLIDAELVRDPSRVVAGCFIQNGSNSVYETQVSTSYTYGWRDAVANSPNLKTTAQAKARADRYLAENATEDDRLTFTVKVPAAHVNDCYAGQALQVKFSHLPGLDSTFHWVRVLTRTVSQPEEDDSHYDIKYECTPLTPKPSGAFAYYAPGFPAHATPTLPTPTVPGNLMVLVVAQKAPRSDPEPVIEATLVAGAGGSSAAWTHVGYVEAYSHAQFGGPGAAVSMGIYWRRVAVGETTTTPVVVQEGASDNELGAWLWQFVGASDPTSTTTLTTDTAGAVPDGGDFTLGAGLTGFVLGAVAIQGPDYECAPVVAAVNGTEVQNCGSNNEPISGYGGDTRNHATPWVWAGTTSSGNPLKGSIVYPACYGSVLSPFGVAGVALVIPGLTSVPEIPWPANVVS